MEYDDLITQEINASIPQFWKTIDIWINNPHLVNRQVSSSVTLSKAELTTDVENFLDRILSIPVDELSHSQIPKGILPFINPLSDDPDLFKDPEFTFLLMRKLFPRDENNFSTAVEFFIVNKPKMYVSWISRNLNSEKRPLGFSGPCKIIFNSKNIKICVKSYLNGDEGNVNWLRERLFPRLVKWIESDHRKNSLVEGSLNLVSPEKYTNLYNSLKKKYGAELVEKWPECTDPAKFVYEDIAIASYLILLWEDERRERGIEGKQSFLDLGCGNGLLVYILTSEGYPGVGIDLRRRKIWDLFSETRLEERTIIPSSKSLFPHTDWLIGNHSDELTPWIPVIAARSSYNCRFFLLPCCAHEFDGRKFQRDSASSSQYSEYLKYIKTVCETCGFSPKLDKLRIPSTKRICFIGLSRNYSEDSTESQDKKIEELINARSLKPGNPLESSDQWARDFKPRDLFERVKNCTKIDRNVIEEIVNLVAVELLQKTRNITINNSDKLWNAGGQIELSEIAKLVPSESLKKLKNECGGLQTLLKNHSHIFQVINGCVQFRVPGSVSSTKKKKSARSKIVLRVKPCFFFNNHPEGCPLADDVCNFKHSVD